MPQHNASFDAKDFIHHFEVYLRSGYSLSQAFEIMANDLDNKSGQEAKLVSQELQEGQSLDQVLDEWLERTPHPDLDLFIATIMVQREVGGNLADKLKLLGQILSHRKMVEP